MIQAANKLALMIGGHVALDLRSSDYGLILTSRSLNSAKQTAEKLNGTVIPLELDISDDSFHFGVVRMVQAFLPLLEAAENARVINVLAAWEPWMA